jgi:ketosteroid isomerase-like protein
MNRAMALVPCLKDPAERAAEDNLQLVREAYRLRIDSGRADETARSISRFVDLLAPDVSFVADAGVWPPCEGNSAVADLLLDAAREWAECSFALEDLRALDPNHVLASGTVLARPAGRTEIYEIPFVNLWTIEGNRATRIEAFNRREQAEQAEQGYT